MFFKQINLLLQYVAHTFTKNNIDHLIDGFT